MHACMCACVHVCVILASASGKWEKSNSELKILFEKSYCHVFFHEMKKLVLSAMICEVHLRSVVHL